MAVKIAVVIGRFQPFHLAHARLLQSALAENDAVFCLVGSADQAPTIKNPFSFVQRKAMIMRAMDPFLNDESKGFAVVDLPDAGPNNTEWIYSVQKRVEDLSRVWYADKERKITLYGAEKDSSSWYVHAFPQWDKKLLTLIPEGNTLNATNLRAILFGQARAQVVESLRSEVPPSTLEFIKEYMETSAFDDRREEYAFIEAYKQRWAVAPYPPTFVTVDGVVIQSGHVLVVRRANQPGKGLIALPGGFVKSNQTLKDALVAEITEETGLNLVGGKRGVEITKDMLRNNIRGFQVFDDPNRSLRGRTITNAFLIRLDDSKPLPFVKGMDAPLEDTDGVAGIPETLHAFWLPLHDAFNEPEIWFEDHLFILKAMYALIKD